MDQIKIGKFIRELRKEKNMTQQELADKLGVTDKSIGNWENGRNMPDLELFKPLCDIFDVTINDLMSGEIIDKTNYQERFEENIVSTINYSTKKEKKHNTIIGHLFGVIGLFIAISAIMIFPSESSWGSVYSVFGILLFTIGVSKLNANLVTSKRLLLVITVFLSANAILLFTDYISVKMNNTAPMFRGTSTYIANDSGNVIYYNAAFYDVIKCGNDYTIVKNKKYMNDELLEYCSKK